MNQRRGIACILFAIFLVLCYSFVWEPTTPLVIAYLVVYGSPILCIIGFILAMLKD